MTLIKTMARLIFFAGMLIGAAAACKVANADMTKVEDLRRYYKSHGLDFFGELIENAPEGDTDAAATAASIEDSEMNEKRHAKVELLADGARVKALTQLEALLKTSKGQMTAELLLRKATLLSDRARSATFFQNNTVRTSKLGDPRDYLRQSILAFQRLEREFADHPKMDIVLFSIAYDYGDLRDSKNAYAYYSKLLGRFPNSPLAGDALLAQAEIDFDARAFDGTIAKLKKIVASEHPRLKNFALYKLAWAYYNVSDLASASAALEKVIDGVNHSNATGAQRARLELRREALHDLVTFYADRPETSAPADAAAYFDRIARTPDVIAADYAQARARRIAKLTAGKAPIPDEETDEYQIAERDELLLRLAQLYRDQGKHLNALTVASALRDKLSGHPRAVALYRLCAESAEKMRRRDQVVAELERLATLAEHDLPAADADELSTRAFASIDTIFGNGSSKDSASKASEAKTPSESKLSVYQKQLLKISFETLNDFASFLHGEWLKTHDAKTAHFAMAAYDLGVRSSLAPWRGQPLAAAFELRRHRAQLHLALEQWDSAAEDFNWISTHKSPLVAADGSKMLTEDTLGEIAALESWLKAPKSAATPAGSALVAVHDRLLAAYDRYLVVHTDPSTAADRQQASEILIASARLHREYKRNDESLRRLMLYSRRFSDQKDAVGATKDILALLNQSTRWEELRDFAAELLKGEAYKNQPVEAEIKRSREYASLRLLEKLEGDKDWDKAASRFAEFARENPESTFASQALLKSANAALENAKLSKNPTEAVTRLEAATEARDEGVRLQAMLGLEPYYRKAYQWTRLKALYKNILASHAAGADAKVRQSISTNLAAVEALGESEFNKAGGELVNNDAELDKLMGEIAKFESETRAYRQLRFVKSNNNPARNFKKKTEMQSELAARAEKIASGAAKSLKGAAQAWSQIVKSELVVELADTLDTAATPAALSTATDADRKSYRDTLAAQSHDLRDSAKTLAEDAAKTLEQVDSPLPLEDRLNTLAEAFGGHPLFAHRDPRVFWSHRPQLNTVANAPSDEAVRKLGDELLRAEKAEDQHAIEARLAETYIARGELGFAYVVASPRDRFDIDVARLAPALKAAIDADHLTTQQRWNLARWLAGRIEGLDAAKDDARKWIDESLAALLRPTAATPVIEAHAQN